MNLSEIEADIEHAWPPDRASLHHRLRGMRQAENSNQPFDRSLDRFLRDLETSKALRKRRRDSLPEIQYDEELPICSIRNEIAGAIAENPVVVVCGETGSGKSTQLPKICLELGRGVDAMIGHTQPRRIAARSVASRVAEELGSTLGQAAGFKVRFTDVTNPETYVKLMTDGILLAETQHDRRLNRYDTIIVDEAHERSLNIDFLLGYLKRLMPRRPDLRVIITSATIDAKRFSEHFCNKRGAAPVIEASGRTYPVEVRYRPLIDDDEPNKQADEQAGD